MFHTMTLLISFEDDPTSFIKIVLSCLEKTIFDPIYGNATSGFGLKCVILKPPLREFSLKIENQFTQSKCMLRCNELGLKTFSILLIPKYLHKLQEYDKYESKVMMGARLEHVLGG